jgi:uncharacterized RDD family membrane protein YckC
LPSEDQIRIDTPEQIQLEFPLAGIGSRFLAIALDTLLQTLLYIAGTFAVFAGSGLAKYLPSFGWISESWAAALVVIFLFSIYWGYFAFFEVIWKGQTPGKRLTGIRVIHQSGRPINIYEAIGRNLMRAVDWLPGMYITGIVSMMISRQNRRLGDHIVGSVVVHDKRPEQIRPDWTAAPSAVAEVNPDIAKITPEELVLIETYLQRRLDLDSFTRDTTAFKIATRITVKTGIQRGPNQSLDDFLESIAKQVRDAARFR